MLGHPDRNFLIKGFIQPEMSAPQPATPLLHGKICWFKLIRKKEVRMSQREGTCSRKDVLFDPQKLPRVRGAELPGW